MSVERSRLWAGLRPLPEPSGEQLEAVRRAVEVRARRQAARGRRRLWLVSSLVVGLMGVWWFWSREEAPGRRAMAARPVGQGVASSIPAAPLGAAPPPAEAPPATSAPAPLAVAVAHRAPSPGVRRGTPDDGEATLLGSALHRLRRDHDAAGALSLLEQYRMRFPRGALRPEATLVRAESLLWLGKHQELADLLAPEVIAELPRSTELSLLRAEALLHLGRCREAIPLFSQVLASQAVVARTLDPISQESTAEARLQERALYGRALCRAQRGQIDAARRDLLREADEFPDQAPKVRQTLESMAQ